MRSFFLITVVLLTALTTSGQTPVQPYPFAPPPGPQIYPHPLVDTNK